MLWALAVAAVILGLTYIADAIYIHHKMSAANSAGAFGSVQFYNATQLKNGKLDIYLESPQTETCVHSLFPHYGYNPCWYAQRNPVHVIARNREGRGIGRATLAACAWLLDNSRGRFSQEEI